MYVFNYWKDALCVNSTEGFIYYQTFEIQVRLFAGMIWAAWCGFLISICIVYFSYRTALELGSISLIVLVVFGYNFHKLRLQEAMALMLLFTSSAQNIK